MSLVLTNTQTIGSKKLSFDNLPFEIKINISKHLLKSSYINYGVVLYQNYDLKLDLIYDINEDEIPLYYDKFNIRNLNIRYNLDKETNQKIMPQNITQFTLGYFVDFEKIDLNLFSNLKELIFKTSCEVTQIINWPSKLERLDLSSKYNYPIDNLPKNLHYLSLGYRFNQKIDKLPENLKTLHINSFFNQKIDNLPNNLEILIFNYNSIFNHPINDLPKELKYLELGNDFNQSLDNLPLNLKYLQFKRSLKQTINNLPSNLEKLIIPIDYNLKIKSLPETLKVIKYGSLIFTNVNTFLSCFKPNKK